jgi:hypothetical protein
VFLRTRYHSVHFVGAAIICAAVVLNLVPFMLHVDLQTNQLFWGIFIVVAAIPIAGSNVSKEHGLKRGPMDVWYFNAAIALVQLGWGVFFAWTVFVPMPKPATYVAPVDFPQYLVDASKCFLGLSGPPCDSTWAVFAVYIVLNVLHNVIMMYIFQRGSAVLAIIAGTAKLVLINGLYYVPIIAGEAYAAQVSVYNLAALGVIVVGIVVYRLRREERREKEPDYPSDDEESFTDDPFGDDDDGLLPDDDWIGDDEL